MGYNKSDGTITASYATGGANFDYVGGLVGRNAGTIAASYATATADGGGGNSDSVGALVGYNSSGTITASHGFGSTVTTNTESNGIDRSADATPAVTGAAGITRANSSTEPTNTWSTEVWNFGSATQNPALIWISAFDGGASDSNADDTYFCNAALLPTAQNCGEIIPEQTR